MSGFAVKERRPAATASAGAILQRQCAACGNRQSAGESCAMCHEGARPLRRRSLAADGGSAREAPPIVHEVLNSPGALLGEAERPFFEPRFNHDFSGMRVHATGKAPSSGTAQDDFEGGEQAVPALTGQSASTGSTPTSTESGRAEECAHPTNFQLGPARDEGESSIYMDITWESSTGKWWNLGQCEIREIVTYDEIPNPPFCGTYENPRIRKAGGAFKCAAHDTHGTDFATGLSRPRTAGTMTARQVYQYQCRGEGCIDKEAWIDFPNQHYTITREVFSYGDPPKWRFRITKAGIDNDYYYQRPVDIPE